MTVNDNQKLDLIIKMIEQIERRADHQDLLLREFRTEWKDAREKDRTEWKNAREEDRAEWKNAREGDRAEWKNAREEDRAEWRRYFEELKADNREIRHDLRIDKEKLEKVYESRYEVKYKIDRDFILKNLGWNLGIITVGVILIKVAFL